MTTEYTHKDIKTIDELIEHIRQNVGMYAGETETPIHLFEECFTQGCNKVGYRLQPVGRCLAHEPDSPTR
ncbi:MAG: hypothetical protein R6U98_09525, partial [Pirellulaceae bacterium]